ncbi:MAG TPA: YeeE/YedE thiosulfate transporter family protein [Chloroflexota bacterium]|jgi:uncharacterized membrane protein YedE/YeeE
MLQWLSHPWPWYVAGPLIGLFVPALLLIGNKQLGVSGSLRALCAAVVPGNVEFFKYDWKGTTAWNLAFVAGIFLGGVIAAKLLGVTSPAISAHTRDAITGLGIGGQVTGLAPASVFSWKALATLRGAVCVLLGGFLVGFGASYGGGCTSGHGITGLASLQLPSLIAMVAIFAGGLLATLVLMPLVF